MRVIGGSRTIFGAAGAQIDLPPNPLRVAIAVGIHRAAAPTVANRIFVEFLDDTGTAVWGETILAAYAVPVFDGMGLVDSFRYSDRPALYDINTHGSIVQRAFRVTFQDSTDNAEELSIVETFLRRQDLPAMGAASATGGTGGGGA